MLELEEITVAACQFNSTIGNVEENICKAERFIKEAAEKKAHIICFPELFPTGYNTDILKEGILSLSIHYSKFIKEKLSKAALENNIYVIAPFGAYEAGKVHNKAFLFDRKGEAIGAYSKIHAFEKERDYYESGNALNVFSTEIGRIGIIICYDAGFPETARSLCLMGAEIIFIPSAWRIQDKDIWKLNMQSRAIENQLFTVGVNRCGKEGTLEFCGNSIFSSPSGKIMAMADEKYEGLMIEKLNLGDLYKERAKGGYLRDRRPEAYKL